MMTKSKTKKTKSEKKAKFSDRKKIVFDSDLDVINQLELSEEQIKLLKKVA